MFHYIIAKVKFLTLMMIFLGCSSPQPFSYKAKKSEKASVYVYRKHLDFGSMRKPTLTVEGDVDYSLCNAGYLHFYIDPGYINFLVMPLFNESYIVRGNQNIDLVANKEYFFEYRITNLSETDLASLAIDSILFDPKDEEDILFKVHKKKQALKDMKGLKTCE